MGLLLCLDFKSSQDMCTSENIWCSSFQEKKIQICKKRQKNLIIRLVASLGNRLCVVFYHWLLSHMHLGHVMAKLSQKMFVGAYGRHSFWMVVEKCQKLTIEHFLDECNQEWSKMQSLNGYSTFYGSLENSE